MDKRNWWPVGGLWWEKKRRVRGCEVWIRFRWVDYLSDFVIFKRSAHLLYPTESYFITHGAGVICA